MTTEVTASGGGHGDLPDRRTIDETIRLGLLDANGGHLRRLWGDAGLLRYGFADHTASDYETYDAVAADRAAVGAAS